ncbi:MAG TPA: hypothetical protein PLD73_01400 [Candidatus Hydrogenedentes bacterium]|nr:hypothetical protein [Candidatus Hydrogenedentota bacterium]
MAGEDFSRIMDKLDAMTRELGSIGPRLDSLEEAFRCARQLEGRVILVESAVRALADNCKAVQDAKDKHRIPWQNIIPAIITAAILALMGAVFALVLK